MSLGPPFCLRSSREYLTCFTLGILWRLFDLDMLAEAENEGGWSKLNTVEKMNGAAARRLNGKAIPMLDEDGHTVTAASLVGPQAQADGEKQGLTLPASLNKHDILTTCLKKLVKKVDGAAFSLAGVDADGTARIDAYVARDGTVEMEFALDFAEIKGWFTGDAAAREALGELDGRAEVYAQVWRCYPSEYGGGASGQMRCMRRTAHSCTWLRSRIQRTPLGTCLLRRPIQALTAEQRRGPAGRAVTPR